MYYEVLLFPIFCTFARPLAFAYSVLIQHNMFVHLLYEKFELLTIKSEEKMTPDYNICMILITFNEFHKFHSFARKQ